jgi:hypothetical protein
MGTKQIGATSSITGLQMTTSVLAPGSGSTRVSTPTSGATEVPSMGAAPSVALATGAAGSASTVVVSMATASGIAAPSACAPAITSIGGKFQRLRLLRMMTTSCEEHIPLIKVASSNVASTATSACGGSVGSRSFTERSSPSVGVLVSSLSHDKSVDFLHHEVAQSATQDWSSTRLL